MKRASHRETSCRGAGAGLAGADRRYHSRANAEHHQNADPNDGSDDGRLGGADQITEHDRLAVGDAVEAKSMSQKSRSSIISSEGPLSSSTPAVQLEPREGVKLPHSCRK